ncbi:MAG TPA: metallophosphoesterase, partial [Porphyromonadaceae bacterium]|nr:metallophosphoesterase [Porphyromonadaceae bacterium]
MKKISILLLTALLYVEAYSQQLAKGYVFDDANRNGKKERRERGIAGVPVSNGLDVVVTDNNGFYSLPVDNDNTLFVIKPSGYKLNVNEDFIPQFYYHYKPVGAPDNFQYSGVAPTGKLPKSIDFALYKYEEPADYTAL